MKKNEPISEQRVKLLLFAKVLNIRKLEGWKPYIGYTDITNISRVLNEKLGLRPQDMDRIAGAKGYKSDVFDLPPRKLSEALGMIPETASRIISTAFPKTNETKALKLTEDDKLTLQSLKGNYKLIYYCRELDASLDNYIAIEDFTIFDFDEASGSCPIQQNNNLMIGDNPVGQIWCRNGVISAVLQYYQTNYPPSMYMFKVVSADVDNIVFTGIYTDITSTPVKSVFSTNAIMYSYQTHMERRKLISSDKVFAPIREILELNEDAQQRLRMVVENKGDRDMNIRFAVNQLRKMA